MHIDISVESQSILEVYATVPMVFENHSVYDVIQLQGSKQKLTLVERPLTDPFTKDYDAVDGDSPLTWSQQFDLTNWGFIVARNGSEIVGGATIAHNTPDVNMLEGRLDLAVLWDIRVTPKFKGNQIGRKLFHSSERWAASKGCQTLKIETQNNNVGACKFYVKMGCQLGTINRFAYPEFPDESQILWYKSLVAK